MILASYQSQFEITSLVVIAWPYPAAELPFCGALHTHRASFFNRGDLTFLRHLYTHRKRIYNCYSKGRRKYNYLYPARRNINLLEHYLEKILLSEIRGPGNDGGH